MIGAGLPNKRIRSTGVSMSKVTFVGAALAISLMLAGPAHAGWELGAGGTKEIDGEATWLATVSYVTAQPRLPWELMAGYIKDRKSTRLNSSNKSASRMQSSA